MDDFFPAMGGSIDETVRAPLTEAFASMAALKNVPLSPKDAAEAADFLLTQTDFTQIFEITKLEGLAARNWALNAHLDLIAVSRLMGMVRDIEGKDDIDDPVVRAVTQEVVTKLDAALASKGCVHWPNLWALVMSRYAGKPRGPTVGVREDGTACTRWWLGVEFHRDAKEGPANIEEKGSLRIEEYWVKGQLHRPPSDGPAIVVTDDSNDGKGPLRVEEYWVEGQLHRPHQDGPAMFYTPYKKFDLSGEEYFENGKWHRPAELGPAVTHWDRKGAAVMVIYYEHGLHHRDPKQGPAWWHIRDGRTERDATRSLTDIKYAVRGQLHRDEEDGPAFILRDNATGVIVHEEYWRNGKQHREGAPAMIERAPDGRVTGENWYCDGELHRGVGEGPATIWRYPDFVFEQWYVNGKQHRNPAEGPAVINHDLVEGTVREEFWVEGNRFPAEGPASVKRDRDGKVIEELFWDGKQLHPQGTGVVRMEARAHG